MNQYVNSFHCAYNNSRGEVVIYMKQERPTLIGLDTTDDPIINERIADVVMDKTIAIELANVLLSLCDNSDSDHELVAKG